MQFKINGLIHESSTSKIGRLLQNNGKLYALVIFQFDLDQKQKAVETLCRLWNLDPENPHKYSRVKNKLLKDSKDVKPPVKESRHRQSRKNAVPDLYKTLIRPEKSEE